MPFFSTYFCKLIVVNVEGIVRRFEVFDNIIICCIWYIAHVWICELIRN